MLPTACDLQQTQSSDQTRFERRSMLALAMVDTSVIGGKDRWKRRLLGLTEELREQARVEGTIILGNEMSASWIDWQSSEISRAPLSNRSIHSARAGEESGSTHS